MNLIDDATEDRQRLIASTQTERDRIDALEFAIIRAVNWLDNHAPGQARDTLLEALTHNKPKLYGQPEHT